MVVSMASPKRSLVTTASLMENMQHALEQ